MEEELIRPIDPGAPRLKVHVYAAIKEAILAGRLPPSQALVEEQLAGMLNISRTPVREALAILEHERLIEPRGGRGLHVRPLRREEFIELFAANEVVEPVLARRAAFLATEEIVEAIAEAVELERKCAATRNLAGFLRAGREFLRLVGLAAENTPLARFALHNRESTDLFLLSSESGMDDDAMQRTIREHEDILGALIRRHPEDAERLTIFHVQSLRQRLADIFQTEGEEE